MATIQRMRVEWSGSAIVGPAISTFYCDPAVASFNPDAVKNFFTAIAGKFVGGVTWTIPNQGDTLEETTGKLTGVWGTTGGGTVSGSAGAADFAHGVGAQIAWKTANVQNGHRVRGRTFLVPMIAAAYKSDGNIDGGTVTVLQNAATALINAHAGSLSVWHRPKANSGGFHAPITSAVVNNQISWLRSRRT